MDGEQVASFEKTKTSSTSVPHSRYTDTRIRWDCLHMYTVDITQHVSKSCFHQLDDDMPTNHDQTDDDRLALRDTG